MMRPLVFRSSGNAAWMSRNVPVTFTAKALSHSSMLASEMLPIWPRTAWLRTRPSLVRNFESVLPFLEVVEQLLGRG